MNFHLNGDITKTYSEGPIRVIDAITLYSWTICTCPPSTPGHGEIVSVIKK